MKALNLECYKNKARNKFADDKFQNESPSKASYRYKYEFTIVHGKNEEPNLDELINALSTIDIEFHTAELMNIDEDKTKLVLVLTNKLSTDLQKMIIALLESIEGINLSYVVKY